MGWNRRWLVVLAVLLAVGAALGADEAEVKRRLAALERAKAAGVLTEEEYRAKRAALEAELKPAVPTLDAATKAKLKALDDALAAGILTRAEYERKKGVLLGGAPAGQRPPAEARPTEADVPDVKQKGKLFRHPAGFQFWHPANWRVAPQEGALQLIPADAGKTAEGPTEIYMILGEDGAPEGITKADDPRVVQYLDTQLRQMLPFMQRSEKVGEVATGRGKGVVLEWSGTAPNGNEIRAVAMVTMVKTWVISLVGLGLKEPLAKREEQLRGMFATFGMGESVRDRRLVGHWRQEKSHWAGAGSDFSSTTIRDMVLAPDGTFQERGRTLASGSGVSLDTGTGDTETGTWAASDGMLYLYYKDGGYAQYGYHVEARDGKRSMLLRPKGGKNQLWLLVQ
jgi:hypothetical protein